MFFRSRDGSGDSFSIRGWFVGPKHSKYNQKQSETDRNSQKLDLEAPPPSVIMASPSKLRRPKLRTRSKQRSLGQSISASNLAAGEAE